jgi:hypothetical protein
MPTRSRSESEQEREGETSAAQAEAGASVQGSSHPKSVGAMAGFRLPLPGIGDVDPVRMLWLGGLAAMATIEIIEWPVALAVGVGSYVAERLAREDVRQDMAVGA